MRGLLRFVDAHSYADSFGFQWHKFDRTQLDHAGMDLSDPDFRRKTGLKPEDLKGKLLNAGLDPASIASDELPAFMRREQERYATVIKNANIKVE